MSTVFLDYSKYYDLLYKEKDYRGEADFIAQLIKRTHPEAKTVLNIGCGTGQHDTFLTEMGFQVTGIDLSSEMLSIAKLKNPGITYHQADARDLELGTKFDVVISLFHVFSYQTKNDDALRFIRTLSTHLQDDGVAIFDYWYGPAVLSIKPESRVRTFESPDLRITRHASTTLAYAENVATVRFDIEVETKGEGQAIKMQEDHPMRYFFTPEIDLILAQTQFEHALHCEWMSFEKAPSEKSWAAYSVVRLSS